MTAATRYDCIKPFDPEIPDQCRALDRIVCDAACQKDLELETALFRKNLRELESEGYRIGRFGVTAVSKAGEKAAKEMSGLTVSHEVPGGIAMVSRSEAYRAFPDNYLGF